MYEVLVVLFFYEEIYCVVCCVVVVEEYYFFYVCNYVVFFDWIVEVCNLFYKVVEGGEQFG